MKIIITDKLTLTDYKGKFWIWDDYKRMNVAMKAETPEEAYKSALTYYQNRLIQIEKEYKELKTKVDYFVNEIKPDEETYQWV